MKTYLVGISDNSLHTYSSHTHSTWEIILNREGYGSSIINDKEYEFAPGTILCIPPNTPHSKQSLKEFSDLFIQISDFPIAHNIMPYSFFDDEEKSFETLMFLALKVFYKKGKNYIHVLDSICNTMCQLLLSWNDDSKRNEEIELFKNELIENFTNPEFHLSNAIKTTAYSRDHFSRCFKKATGTTPLSYLLNLRIEYAKNLLAQISELNMTISDISLMCGFYDPRYFSRIFKKRLGITPQEYTIAKRNDTDM